MRGPRTGRAGRLGTREYQRAGRSTWVITSTSTVAAVPQYYEDDRPHLNDTVPHDRTRGDAIAAVAQRRDVAAERLGLVE